jgi:hypothetical protein
MPDSLLLHDDRSSGTTDHQPRDADERRAEILPAARESATRSHPRAVQDECRIAPAFLSTCFSSSSPL